MLSILNPQIEFPSILLPPDISSGSIVDITVAGNAASEKRATDAFQSLQDRILTSFGSESPARPVLRCLNATQTSVVLEWDPVSLATADLISLSLYRNGQKAGNIPRPLQMHSTKISGLAVDTEYTFHLVLRTTAGTYTSDRVAVRTHKMTDLSGITITTGILPPAARETLAGAVERIGARLTDAVRIDTTHFVTTEGRGIAWEKAVESNIPVVRPEWVEACEKSGRILGVTKYYLDAMRPGPVETPVVPQQAPAQVQVQKDLPPTPEKPEERSEEKEAEAMDEKSSSEEKEDAEREEDKQKAISPDAEQKVRVEEKDGQKIALRPVAADAKSDNGEDEAEGRDSSAKPGASPDGASFQEVEL